MIKFIIEHELWVWEMFAVGLRLNMEFIWLNIRVAVLWRVVWVNTYAEQSYGGVEQAHKRYW